MTLRDFTRAALICASVVGTMLAAVLLASLALDPDAVLSPAAEAAAPAPATIAAPRLASGNADSGNASTAQAATPAVDTTTTPQAGPAANGRHLTLVSWGGAYQDALRDTVFQPFTDETGVPFAEDMISGTLDEVRTALADGRGWDLINLEYADTLTGCAEGLFEVLDWNRLGDTTDLIPAAIETCGVGNVVWAYVMAYDHNKVNRTPVSWADFWDLEGFPGPRGLRNLAQWNLEAALLADGVPPRDIYVVLSTPAGVDRAFAMLDRIKPHVVWWSAGAEPMELMGRGEVVMSTAYNARVAAGRAAGVNARTVWNGIIYTIDYWVIGRGSRNLDEAYRFLNYTSKPQSMARLASATFWNREGRALEQRFQQWIRQ